MIKENIQTLIKHAENCSASLVVKRTQNSQYHILSTLQICYSEKKNPVLVKKRKKENSYTACGNVNGQNHIEN